MGRKKPTTAKPKRKVKPSAWIKALKAEGYMKPGADFKPVPKKGTPEYEKVRRRMEKIKKQEAKKC